MEVYHHSSGDPLNTDSAWIRCPECGAHMRELSYVIGAFTVLGCGPCGHTFRLDARPRMPASVSRTEGTVRISSDEEAAGPLRIVRLPLLELGSLVGADDLPLAVEIELHVRVL